MTINSHSHDSLEPKKGIRRRFIHNVMLMMGGTAAAQILTLLVTPIVSRLYSPVVFGLMGSFMAIIDILVPISTFSFAYALALPKTESDGLELLNLCFRLIVFATITLIVVSALFGNQVLVLLKLEALSPYLMLIPFSVFIAAIFLCIQQWLIRTQSFQIIAVNSFYYSVFNNAIRVLVGVLSPTAWGLIGAMLVSRFLQCYLMMGGLKSTLASVLSWSYLRDISIAKKYKDFAFYRTPQILISGASQSLPILLLTALNSSASAGYFLFCKLILGAPSLLIGKAVGDVIYPKLVEMKRENLSTFSSLFMASLSLLGIGIVPFSLVWLFSIDLFFILFGAEWAPSGEFAKWLAVYFFLHFISRPAVSAIPVLGLEKQLLFYELVSSSFRLAALILGLIYFENVLFSIAFFSTVGALAYASLILYVLIKSKGV